MSDFFTYVAEGLIKEAQSSFSVPESCLDERMFRLATIAAQVGQDLAKTAGIGSLVGNGLAKGIGLASKAIPFGWKGKALVGAGLLGGGYAMYKGTQALGKAVTATPQPATYGNSRFGYRVPNAVNSSGTPDFNTSFE